MDNSKLFNSKYFAGANTEEGFLSFYDDIFESCDLLYIIKGGSGSGKSYFMKEVARFAESKDKKVEYFYCSFDSDSIDGIIVYGYNLKIGILDGTAPHVVEAKLVCARDRLLNFEEFLDDEIIRKDILQIKELTKLKKDCFEDAYNYLKSYGKLEAIKDNIIKKSIKKDKIEDISDEVLKSANCSEIGKVEIRPLSSIGKNGCVRFSTFCEKCDSIISLGNKYNEGYLVMSRIFEKAKERHLPIKVSFSWLSKNKIDEILINDKVCISLNFSELYKYKLYNHLETDCVLSVYNEDIFEELERMQEYIKENTVKLLQDAFKIHSDIESIYIDAMDFKAKEEFTKKFIEKISIHL